MLESIPKAGLSACNETEANAVVSLTKYMLTCGVPPASITIITPYKGQKTLITKSLARQKIIPPFRKDNPPPRGTTIIISTVDKYQGDENDIVILSLVRVKAGNRFVALKNRFIVATSRARLGFYVVGSVGAVTEANSGSKGPPEHWTRFVSSLREAEGDDDKSIVTDLPARVGASLPICCPRHGPLDDKYVHVQNIGDFPSSSAESWNLFCKRPCEHLLPRCKHPCGLKCHCPITISHNQKCEISLERKCKKHFNYPLYCYEIKIDDGMTVEEALGAHECEVEEEYSRPECSHTLKVTCHVKNQIESGKKTLEKCTEGDKDYTHPACGHVLKSPKCYLRLEYEKRPPECRERVIHTRPCKCKKKMFCYEKINEQIKPPQCNNSVNFKRPRCGHNNLSMRCNDSIILKEAWSGMPARYFNEENTCIVVHGEEYGKSESETMPEFKLPECQVPVMYEGKCGHIINDIACCSAFEYASGLKEAPKCETQVKIECPFCFEVVEGSCWLADDLDEWTPWQRVAERDRPYKDSEGVSVISEKVLLNMSVNVQKISSATRKLIPTLCKSKVKVVRSCDQNHFEFIDCRNLLNIMLKEMRIKKCKKFVDRSLPCAHFVKVPCCEKDQEPPPICKHPTDDVYTYSCGQHTCRPGTCNNYSKLMNAEEPPLCQEIVTTKRYRCGHAISLPCCDREKAETVSVGLTVASDMKKIVRSDLTYCEPERDLEDCDGLVSYRHNCNHVQDNVPCPKAFMWAEGDLIPDECTFVTTENLNPICSHPLSVKCCYRKAIFDSDWAPWDYNNQNPPSPKKELLEVEGGEKVLMDTFEEIDIKDMTHPHDCRIRDALQCSEKIILYLECGHETSMKCSDAFFGNIPLCERPVPIRCMECDFVRMTTCGQNRREESSGERMPCENICRKLCTICKINHVDAPCYITETVRCEKEVNKDLDCGHIATWICGEEIHPHDPTFKCRACFLKNWEYSMNYEPTEDDIGVMKENLKSRIKAFVSTLDPSVEVEVLADDQAVEAHIKDGRNKVLKLCYEYMNGHKRSDIINVDVPLLPQSVEFPNCYDIGFIMKGDEWPEAKPNEYGYGRVMKHLDKQSLLESVGESTLNDEVEIIIGVAFRHKCVENSPPLQAKRGKKGGFEKANKRLKELQNEGYDCISYEKEAKVPASDKIKTGVYWTPKSCIPFIKCSIKLHEFCLVCYEMHPYDVMYKCSQSHFICWDMLQGFMTSSKSPDSVGKTTDENGNIYCCEDKCKEIITFDCLSKANAPKDVFDALEELKKHLDSSKKVYEALKSQKEDLRREHKREMDEIMNMANVNERNAEMKKKWIIENIMTIKCPRCKQPFDGFDGCFAVSCTCGCGFCGWCLMDCGVDAHRHVSNCPERPPAQIALGDIYGGGTGAYEEYHRERRRKLVIEELNKESVQECQELILSRLEKVLEINGIKKIELSELNRSSAYGL